MDNTLAIEKLRSRTARDLADRAMVIDLLKNPVVQILAGYLIVEASQRAGIIEPLAGTVAEGGIIAAVSLQQLSAAMPALTDGASKIIDAVGKTTAASSGSLASLIPLLGAATVIPGLPPPP
jgi:hypothetical protein